MRLVILLMLVASTAFAQPGKSKVKRAPDKFTKAASDAFAAAAEADAKGDLNTALGLYEKAHAISPHPATIYNIADVQRRLSILVPAIKSYEMYLALAPDAKDRAEVETLLDQIRKTPGKLIITTSDQSDKQSVDLASGYVFVAGKLERKPGPVSKGRDGPEIVLMVPPGELVVDIVTPLTYAHESCKLDPGGQRICRMRAEPRIDGNVVVSSSDRMIRVSKLGEKNAVLTHKRFQMPAGKQRMVVNDRSYGCAPLAFDAPAGGNTVVYSFIDTREWDGYKRCRTLDIKQQRLQFEQ